MPSLPRIVVGAAPGLANELEKTAAFPAVTRVSGTKDLLGLITSTEMQTLKVSEVVFVFSDEMQEDDPNLSLSEILRRLTGAQYQVVIVATTPQGASLQQQHPKAGLLTVPIRLNEVLFAIGTFGYPIDPVENGYAELSLRGGVPAMAGQNAERPQSTPTPSAGAQATTTTGWTSPAGATERLVSGEDASGEAPAARGGETPSGGARESESHSFLGGAPQSVETRYSPPPSQPEPFVPRQVAHQSSPASSGFPGVSPEERTETPAPMPAAFPAAVEPRATTSSSAGNPAPQPVPPPAFPPPQEQGNPFGQTQQAPFAPTPQAFADPAPAFAPPAPAFPPAALAGGPQASAGWAAPSVPAPDPWASQSAPPAQSPPAFQGIAARHGSPADAQIGRAPRRGYVITIAVSKGGVGKSSMTLNLAAFLGMRLRSQGKTVCVIDANYQQADSGKYLDTYTPNINTIVNNPSLLTRDRILEALVHRPEYNLSVLLGPATPDEGNPLAISARLYNEVLDLIKAHYDYVLIDTPVAEKFHEMFSDFALPRADYVVVPVAPNFTTLHNADNWLRAAVVAPRNLGGAGLDPNRVGIVLNRAEDGIGCSEEDVRQTMASWHFLGAIPETKEWKACNNRNELVAPRNYAELSQAFAEVMHAATGEPVLIENFNLGRSKGGGLGGKLRGLMRRGS